MAKRISVSDLRAQLGEVLDQLNQGQSHFVIERNHQEVAVLLSIEKFKDIMQMLELFNTLEFIETSPSFDDIAGSAPALDFPEFQILSPGPDPQPTPELDTPPAPARSQKGQKLEAAAAKLGIRLIK